MEGSELVRCFGYCFLVFWELLLRHLDVWVVLMLGFRLAVLLGVEHKVGLGVCNGRNRGTGFGT